MVNQFHLTTLCILFASSLYVDAQPIKLLTFYPDQLVQRDSWLVTTVNSSHPDLVIHFDPVKPFRPLLRCVWIELLKSPSQVLSVTENFLKQYHLTWPANVWYGTTNRINNQTVRLQIYVPSIAMIGRYSMRIENARHEKLDQPKLIYVDVNDSEMKDV